MPLYDYICNQCEEREEMSLPMGHLTPSCCGLPMRRLYTMGDMQIRMKYPMWVDRMDDIHKAQQQKGEKLRFVHPKEILA